ncbi:hypothetical protein PI27_gp006 [Listeria phage WIL-1]|nr:hypothetical protein PI27_gp006 [Listeria phage WIL-1]
MELNQGLPIIGRLLCLLSYAGIVYTLVDYYTGECINRNERVLIFNYTTL